MDPNVTDALARLSADDLDWVIASPDLAVSVLTRWRRRRRIRAVAIATLLTTATAGAAIAAVQLVGSHAAGKNIESVRQPTPASTVRPQFTDTAPIGSGDDHPQRFCATPPAAGSIQYVVSSGAARLVVRVHRLGRPGRVGIAFAQGPTHTAQVVASFRVDRAGRSQQSSLRFFHAPYYRRPGTQIALVTNSDRVIARAYPC